MSLDKDCMSYLSLNPLLFGVWILFEALHECRNLGGLNPLLFGVWIL